MANLLDAVQAGRQKLLTTPAAQPTQTDKLQQLMQARSGKAVGGGEFATSNLEEQQAALGATAQVQQLAPSLALQGVQEEQQAAATQQQTQQQLQQVETQRQGQQLRNRIETNALLSDLERDRGTLNLEKDRDRLEQTAFRLRMADTEYVDTLKNIGKQRRYDDKREFDKAIEEEAFHGSIDLLRNKLDGQSVLNASDRDFKVALSQLSIDDAIAMAGMEAQHIENMAALDRQSISQGAADAAKKAKLEGQLGMITGLSSALGTFAGTDLASSLARPSTPATSYSTPEYQTLQTSTQAGMK